MNLLGAYIPTDRRWAIARRRALPDRTRGAALFADISGFTPLTEQLAKTLGPRRGVEEMTVLLNDVYDAVISEIDQHGGSVIAFAGDAITCWFDGDSGARAMASALAIQQAMEPFAQGRSSGSVASALALKAGIAVGPARRFLVGDPERHVIDVMAGRTLARMAAATSLAGRGQVVIETSGIGAMVETAEIPPERASPMTGGRFAVVKRLLQPVPFAPPPVPPLLDDASLRAWLLPPVYRRLQAGQGEFLTELRPCVALFLRFEGIEYDADDDAGRKLDQYVRWVQSVLDRHEGFLIDVSIGDKGSYLYGAFGAPIAHEDDTARALETACELRHAPGHLAFIRDLQVGISRGAMRTGAYGGKTRRTYGVLGDEVNLAARLMEHAGRGQVLVSNPVRQAAANAFTWQSLPPIKAKGKTDPIPVFTLEGKSAPGGHSKLNEPAFELPLVGREAELRLFDHRLGLAESGRGQLVLVTSEAGVGKSRLVAEFLRRARGSPFRSGVGECQSNGTNTSYLCWRSVWQSVFKLNPALPAAAQNASLTKWLSAVDRGLLGRLPLLGTVLGLALPDNEVTAGFDAKLRKSSLEALLIDCLRHATREQPLLVVLEDCHWIDPLSRDLLEVIARAIATLPVLLVVTARPPDHGVAPPPAFRHLPWFTEVILAVLTADQSAQLLRSKLAQRRGPSTALPPAFVERMVARAEGNPFYLEELLNYLVDQGVDPADAAALDRLEWPSSLHSLILSRIDKLTESQKTTLKVASVIGRLFEPATVWGVHPDLHESQVRADLEELKKIDLIPLDRPEPDLRYIFKHAVTQEVAYESLAFATRARLHERIGLYLEQQKADSIEQRLDLLAFHFDRSHNQPKKREYLLKAAESARDRYANAAAISYFERAVPLLDEPERIPVLLKLGRVLETVGEWKKAGAMYQRAHELAIKLGDRRAQAQCHTETGELCRKQGFYEEATNWLALARALFEELGDREGVAQTLHYSGTVAATQGAYDPARTFYEQSLEIRRALGDRARTASLLSNLGILARYRGDYAASRALMEDSLGIRRALGDRWAIANSLNNLGVVLRDMEEFGAARPLLEESLSLNRQAGDRWAIANSLSSLGELALNLADYERACECLVESMSINRELGEPTAIAFLLEYFAKLSAARHEPDRALRLAGAAWRLRESVGSPLSPSEQAQLDRAIEAGCAGLADPDRIRFTQAGRAMKQDEAIEYALSGRSEMEGRTVLNLPVPERPGAAPRAVAR